MMAEVFVNGLLVVLVVAGYVLMFGLPFVYVLRNGNLYKGVAYSWFFQILHAFVMSVPVPAMLFGVFPEHKDLIYNMYPEANGIVAALISGWLTGLIVCGIAQLIYRRRNRENSL